MKWQLKLILFSVAVLSLVGKATRAEEILATNATLSLDQVLSEVRSNNPSLKAARATWEAMNERIPQARAWEDARFGVDVVAGRFVSVPRNSFTDNKFMAEQALPLSGKNRLRGKAASAEASAAFSELRRRELDLIARASAAYFRLAKVHEQLALNQKNLALLKQFAEISRAKYEVGTKPQSDVLVAETDSARLQEVRFDLERELSDSQSQLNVLMNRPAQTPLGRPEKPTLTTLELTLDPLQSLSLSHRPELFIAQEKIHAAQARLEAARREWIPDPSFRVEASQYNEGSQAISEVVAGFSFNLPWFNRKKYSAGIRENKKMVESAEQELQALNAETLGLVRDQLKKVQTFHHHAELFRDSIVPLAQQNVAAIRASYETDKAGFLNLIDAQRTAQEVEAMYWNHLTDYRIALAELEALIGTNPGESPAATPEKK